MRRVSNYKYYLVKDPILNKYARILYSESLKALIFEYRGNLELLNSITVHPAYQGVIYPFLKRAIDAAGGEWNKAQIPELSIDYINKNY